MKKKCQECKNYFNKPYKNSIKQWNERKYCSSFCASSANSHGMVGTSTYRAWAHMKERCENLNDKSYKHYGGRGISICKRWRKFENFLKDMGKCPKGYTLDRINVNKNYTLKNCRWASAVVQQNNRRNNHLIKYDGEIKTVADWARQFNMSPSLLRQRITRDNFPFEEAINKPSNAKIWYQPKTLSP